jgi:hypothetical protein
VPELDQLTRPVVGTSTRLQPDQTRRLSPEELEHLSASHFLSDDLAVNGDPVDLEPALRYVESDRECHGPPPVQDASTSYQDGDRPSQYARDDRPWGGPEPPAVAYVYAPDRKAERPSAHLAGFRGVLQVDGYAGYRALAEAGQVQLAFCWSHVRRRFYEIAAGGNAPLATEALVRIVELYAVEAEMRGRSAEERRTIRCERSRPIVDDFRSWMAAKLALVSQKSAIAEAIRYATARWEGLCRFLDDGRVEIDSNTVERTIRPIALSRKNALFAGSDGGGEHSQSGRAVVHSIESCRAVRSQVYPQMPAH